MVYFSQFPLRPQNLAPFAVRLVQIFLCFALIAENYGITSVPSGYRKFYGIMSFLRTMGFIPPQSGSNALELIEYYGYPLEIHEAVTEDGYILQMHRIPYGRRGNGTLGQKPVAYLLPGFISTTAVFVINGPENSLAFLLADYGYDVWIGNPRGSTFSRRHVSLDPDLEHKEFFNFSLSEIGLYDLPTHIDYILNHTGQDSLYFIGHSQGSTDFLIMASERPEYNKKIRLSVHLAPTAFSGNTPNPIFRILSKQEKEIRTLASELGIDELMRHQDVFILVGAIFCNDYSPIQELCASIFYFLGGRDREQFNYSLLPVIASTLPGGSSLKELAHYAQLVNSGKFAYFDYGKDNYLAYRQDTPPDFKLENIACPMALYYGLNDGLSAPMDVQKLASRLPNVVINQAVPYKKFTHLDFVFSKDLKKLVLDDVIKLLSKY